MNQQRILARGDCTPSWSGCSTKSASPLRKWRRTTKTKWSSTPITSRRWSQISPKTRICPATSCRRNVKEKSHPYLGRLSIFRLLSSERDAARDLKDERNTVLFQLSE